MKNKLIRGLLFFINGLTAQYLVSFGRSVRIDYIKIFIIFAVFFLAGWIIRSIEKKIFPYTIIFLISGIGIMVFAFIANPEAYTSWLIELTISIPSFFIGFYLLNFTLTKRLVFVFSWFAAVLLFAFIINPRFKYATQFANYENKKNIGNFSSFKFIDENNKIVTQNTYKDKIVLLDYWFIGCGPCYLKMKELKKIAAHYENRNDVVLLTIDAGFRDSYENFLTEIKKFPDNLRYAYDCAAVIAKQFEVKGYPTEIIIDKRGVIRHQFVGYNSDVSLVYVSETIKKIDALLNEK